MAEQDLFTRFIDKLNLAVNDEDIKPHEIELVLTYLYKINDPDGVRSLFCAYYAWKRNKEDNIGMEDRIILSIVESHFELISLVADRRIKNGGRLSLDEFLTVMRDDRYEVGPVRRFYHEALGHNLK